ncbi:MinD/ParA family protein [Cryptosporangium sp. NPDC048952]|uniref:MinD/ParA family ATP-binding protein n=1 Tax=Cryptosporangium sp. NPDC048952 TaxID=3363961 RepID=UPI003716CBE9
MGLLSLVSARGSPGVTTTALAMTLTWGAQRMVLAECDPAGGTVRAGYLRGEMEGELGLTPLALSMLRAGPTHPGPPARPGQPPASRPLSEMVWGQLVDLDAPHRERLVLPGLADPAQSAMVAPLWPQLTTVFEQLGQRQPGYDVVADCGRLHATANIPWPVLTASQLVLLVVRSELTSVSAAMSAVGLLQRQLRERSGNDQTLGVLLIGERPYSAASVAEHLGVPVITVLPYDVKTATALSRGGPYRLRSPLIRAALGAERDIRRAMRARETPRAVTAAPRPGGMLPPGASGQPGQVARRG